MHQESPPGKTATSTGSHPAAFANPVQFVCSFLRNGTGFVTPEFVDSDFSGHGISPPPLVGGGLQSIKPFLVEGGMARDALEGKAPRMRPQRRLAVSS